MKKKKILPALIVGSMIFAGSLTSVNAAENTKENTAPVIRQTMDGQGENQAVPLAAGSTVYLNTASGVDTNDGSSASKAVLTLDKALALAGAGGTIVVDGNGISISSEVTLDNITFKKAENYKDTRSLISVLQGGNLTLNNVVFDGSKASDTDKTLLHTCVAVQDGQLTVNKGAVFKNAVKGIDIISLIGNSIVTINGGEFFNLGDSDSVYTSSVISIDNFMNRGIATLNITDVNIHDNKASNGVLRIGGNSNNPNNVICNMSGGTITKNQFAKVDEDYDTSGVLVDKGGTFNFSGGEISYNKGYYGGGMCILSEGTVNMTGGKIAHNETSSATFDYGGGIAVRCGTLKVSGGEISDNSSLFGGGISATGKKWTSDKGTNDIEISGDALITRNEAKENANEDYEWTGGGGIYINSGKLAVKGGEISHNKASYGGGIDTGYGASTTIEGNVLITGNEVTEVTGQGGGIGVHDGTLTLNGATISENKGYAGSGLGIWNNATVIMDGNTRIINNEIIADSADWSGGAVFVSSDTNDGSKFIMKDGEISGNTGGETYCGGIFVYGYNRNTVAQISGGIISNNTNVNKDDQSIMVRGNLKDDGTRYEGYLRLSGSPQITGQVFLRTDTSDSVKVDVVDAFTPKEAVKISVIGWTNNRTIVTYAEGIDPDLDQFVPYDASETQAIIKKGQDLKCMNKLRVIFRDADGKVAKDMYVMPNTKIGEEELPTVTKDGYTFKNWKEGNSGKKWDFTQNEITEELTVFVPEWQAASKVCRVKYVTNCSVPIADNGVKAGEKAIKPEITIKGSFIEGWYTTADFQNGTKWDFDNPVTEDITLHAKWELNKPTATLEAEGNITTVHTGKTVKLIATANHEATGEITYSYQWYKDGKELKGKTRAAQGTNEMEVDETGSYTVKVTASDGTFTSSAVEAGPVKVKITDHTYTGDWKQDENQHWKECDECGEKGEAGDHAYGEWKVVKEATESKNGLAERTCEVCGHKQTKETTYNDPVVPGNNTAPTIEAKDVVLTVGETFEAKNYAKASDAEDGDLTDQIKIVADNVDVTKAGTYEVTYLVTDSQGLSRTRTIKVTVKEKDSNKGNDDSKETPTKTEQKQNDTKETVKIVKTVKTVKTGDNTNSMIYVGLAGISLICVILVCLKKKRDEMKKSS